MIKKLYPKNIFYGWFIVAAGFMIMSVVWGIVYNSSSIFIKPISADMGFTRSQVSATMTIRAACHMIIALFSGKIFAKYNIRRIMQVTTVTLFISFFAYSYAKSLLMFYFLTIIISASASLVSILPVAIIISNWFYERRGFAIGIAFMGSGVGGMIFSSLAGLWVVNYGWRTTYQILAVIMLLAIIPCTFFIIRLRPKDMGLLPYGESTQSINNDLNQEEDGIMLSEALKTIRFWAILICSVIILISINALMLTISPHLSDIGYSITFSANILALTMGALALGKLLLGYMFDKLGLRATTTLSCFATLFAMIGLIFANHYIALVIIIIGAGLGSAYATIANPIITQSLFGRRDYISIYGVLSAANALGGVIAPILTGYIFDRTGSYITSFIIMAILSFIVLVTYQFIFPKTAKIKIENV